MRFVRSSKYRHVFGTASKRDQCYDNIRVSRNAWDTNLCKVNSRFLSINLECSGGGQFQVIPLEMTGKIPMDFPVFAGHTAAVLDTDFNPFNDYVIASCGEDCKVLVWTIPAEGFGKDTENITAPALEFAGHNRKVGHVLFNPVAENVLLSSAADLLIKLYDVQKGSEKQSIQGHPDIINSVAYNYNGSIVATCCKDKKVRLVDVRDGKIVQEADAHQGVKGSRACWLGDSNYLITTGFSKSCDRQLMIWDGRMMDAPVKSENLDTSSGILMPHYDNDTKMLYLAGKGDGNIRYWEFAEEAPFTHYLSDFKSSDPQRGVAFLPKRACNVGECEVARVFKVHPDRIEPISFKVPRKSDQFQSDIFPDTIGDAPSLSADEWFGGKNADPKLISLENGFQPSAKKEFQTEAFAGKSGKASSESKLLSSEKDYQDAYHQLRKENEALKNEIAQKDVRLRQLELQLEQLSSK